MNPKLVSFSCLTGAIIVELLDTYNITAHMSAMGKYGSVVVTERNIKTLKCDWLKRVSLSRALICFHGYALTFYDRKDILMAFRNRFCGVNIKDGDRV